MKKILLLLVCFTFILTGCVNPQFLAKPENFANDLYSEAEEVFAFNREDFPYSALGCWGQILCETPGNLAMDFDYDPVDGFDHIRIQMSRYGFTPMAIADTYLADYFANEYIIDESIGNDIDDYFLKLEDEGIKYYISEVQGIESTEHYDQKKIKRSDICVIDMEQFDMEADIIDYLGGKDSETIDWNQFINDYNCSPNLQVYVNRENLKEHGVTLEEIGAESKKYYNQDTMTVTFEYPDFSEDANIYNYYYADATTKSQRYEADSMLDENPQYNWGEN